MLFHVSCELEYSARFPSTLILNLQAQANPSQKIVAENFWITPMIPAETFQLSGSDSRFLRLETGGIQNFTVSYNAQVECDFDYLTAHRLDDFSIAEMDRNAIPFLFPSRYCQSDRLSRIAWDLFGEITNPYDKVVAIVDWIHNNVEYVLGTTNSETSAYDTVIQRVGVCRDFAHLGIALCRALNIPARYFSGYAYQLAPPDFHACFEAYIGGRWMIFDATRLAHLNGLIRIGTGRDAADAAVASIFGSVTCGRMTVDCQLGQGQSFVPHDRKDLDRKGVSLDAN